MKVVKQSSLQQMMFTENGFEITENTRDLEKRIDFAKTLLNLQFTGKSIMGWEFTLFEYDSFSDILHNLGFRLKDDVSVGSLGNYMKSYDYFRAYFYKPTIDDFKSSYKIEETKNYYNITQKSFMIKWPYHIGIKNALCDAILHFKTEEEKEYFEKELLSKYKKHFIGSKKLYCENCNNFIFLTPPLKYDYKINEKEQFYFKLGHNEENGIISRLWVDKVVFFVDNLKISVYEKEVLEETEVITKNNQKFTIQNKVKKIEVKKEKVE